MKHLEEIRRYWDSRSEGYRMQVDEEIRDHREEEYRAFFRNLPAGSEVLDIGCGPGFFTRLLSSLSMKVTAADYSEEMLKQARNLLSETPDAQVRFFQADAQKLPFNADSFDAVVSRNLVWNLENPEFAYREWLRILKPGGRLFVFDGNHYCYLFDKTYADIHKTQTEQSKHILLGVKTSVIDEIAQDLPLSRHVRPDWDKAVLAKVGFVNISAEILKTVETRDKRLMPTHFAVLARKP